MLLQLRLACCFKLPNRFSCTHAKDSLSKFRAISFSGCGFLGSYHLGAADVLSCGHFAKYAGASGGALAAAMLAICPDKKNEALHELDKWVGIMLRTSIVSPKTELAACMELFLESVLPKDAHTRASGRVFVAVSDGFMGYSGKTLVSEFHSKEDFIQCLLCSCFIPMWTGRTLPMFRGQKVCDGGFTDMLPRLPEATLTVSPFAGEADISPQDLSKYSVRRSGTRIACNYNNVVRMRHALFPNSRQLTQMYYDVGRKDAERFMLSL